MNRQRDLVIGAVLALLTLLCLAGSESQVGYARDEGVYFEASRHYGAWAARLVREPGKAMERKRRDRAFRFNREHPTTMKLAAGVSARLLAQAPAQGSFDDNKRSEAPSGGVWPVMREGAAMRLPAQALAAFGAFLLFWAGRRRGGSVFAGILAAGSFVLLPRVFFHSSLHAFDVPITVLTLAVALAWLKALSNPRWALAVGPLLGLAITVKHNALFLAPLLCLHYLGCLIRDARATGKRPTLSQLIALPVVSLAVLAPLTAFLLWPWMWHDTLARVTEYFAFHAEHSYYNMEFLGRNYNRPPLPISYPLVLTLATVPAVLLVLGVAGAWLGWSDPAAQESKPAQTPRSFLRPLPAHAVGEGRLIVLLAIFPLLLIASPTIPIFGGTKHWLTAYPFLALAAAKAWGCMFESLSLPKSRAWMQPLALVLVLVPGAWSTASGHPYGLSQYAPLAGGARGAADMGLNRGFWGHAVTALLADTEGQAKVYMHDIHELARKQYAREGRWPQWRPTRPEGADTGLIFHERHMLTDEIRLQNALGSSRPRSVVTLHDVPLTSQY